MSVRFPITVYTDHKNLEYFNTTKQLNRRQARWAELLSDFNFVIIYRKGSQNGKADALSRRPEYRFGRGGDDRQPIRSLLKPGQLQLNDPPHVVVSSVSLAALLQTSHLAKELLDEVRQVAKQDAEYQQIMQSIKRKDDKVDKHLSVSEELLWFKQRLYIPNIMPLRLRLLEHDHDSKVAGHWGQAKTLELLTRNWYWPNMEVSVNDYVRTCDSCQHNKFHRHK